MGEEKNVVKIDELNTIICNEIRRIFEVLSKNNWYVDSQVEGKKVLNTNKIESLVFTDKGKIGFTFFGSPDIKEVIVTDNRGLISPINFLVDAKILKQYFPKERDSFNTNLCGLYLMEFLKTQTQEELNELYFLYSGSVVIEEDK